MKNQTAIYLRLSRDDGEVSESNSIQSQRDIIRSYAEANNLTVCNEYVDDGISGATFDRPSFNRMMEDMEAGRFNCIAVKDLSRFGRDYIEAGKYIQKIFPERHIRFISITDNYDSEKADTNDTHLILPIRNFINDSYCRDISMKVKSTQRTKRELGEFIGAFAPFGYRKSEADKHKLEIDETVRHTVEKIFYMKLEGYSSLAIAGYLNEAGAVTPSGAREQRGEKQTGFMGVSNKWDAKMVNRIINNRVYMGTLEQGKQTQLSYKSKHVVKVDSRLWSVKPKAHPAIVSESIFKIANEMQKRDLMGRGKPHILSGLLFCGDCGSQLVRRKVTYKGSTRLYYICGRYNDRGGCTRHSVREDDILEVTGTVINDYVTLRDRLYTELSGFKAEDCPKPDLSRLTTQRSRYEIMRQSLFEDLDEGLITEEEFKYYRTEYAARIVEITKSIERKKEIYEEICRKLKNGRWLLDISPDKNGTIDRFSLTYLVNRIEVKENKELSFVFYDDEKTDVLKELVRETVKPKNNAVLLSDRRGAAV